MRIAIIDLGTNSIRFDVQHIGPNGKTKALHREKLMVRLGQGVFLDGKLNKSAINRTIQTLATFRKTAEKLHAKKIIAFATSALREAADRETFIDTAHKKAGVDLRIISGQEEATLIAQGILANESLPKGRFALVDIGGGSTEISICRGKKVLHSESFNVGTSRLQQVFLKQTPPKPDSIESLRRYIKSILLPKLIAEDWPRVDFIIASSGTSRALARLISKKENSKGFTRGELKDITKKLSKMNAAELMDMEGMEARRVDMITGGAILLDEIMQILGAKKTQLTSRSLRDGILQEELNLYKRHTKSHITLHVPDLIDRAKKFGGDEAHLKHVSLLAENLFDKTRTLHKLNKEWRIYLVAAMILRNVGETITLTKHELHSAYIVRNLDLYSMEPWESELIAELCANHEAIKPEVNTDKFKQNKALKTAFIKLLALLRVADALDIEPSARLKIRSSKVSGMKILFKITGHSISGLEKLRIEQKQPLFIETFGKQPNIC